MCLYMIAFRTYFYNLKFSGDFENWTTSLQFFRLPCNNHLHQVSILTYLHLYLHHLPKSRIMISIKVGMVGFGPTEFLMCWFYRPVPIHHLSSTPIISSLIRNRTLLSGLKVQSIHQQCFEGICVIPQGFEPWILQPKWSVLPLHYGTILLSY